MNDFDGQEPGTIESILKFTKETYGANFEIFDKVNFQVFFWTTRDLFSRQQWNILYSDFWQHR